MITCCLLHLLLHHFFWLLTKFHRNISSGGRENAQNPFKKALKIDRFRVKFSHRRQRAMKKWMTHLWKIILRRFRISNQIFHSIYGSPDIERSLDTTLAVFRPKLALCGWISREPNLFWTWNFQGLFLALLSSISEVFKKFLSVVIFCQIKTYSKMHVFVFCGWSKIFMDNPASSLFSVYQCLTSCQVSRKSLEPFLRKMDN